MTENLAGRGEGLAGLAKGWRERAQLADGNAKNAAGEINKICWIEKKNGYLLCAADLETALEAAARLPSVGQAPPSTGREMNSLLDEGAHRMADLLTEHSAAERKRRPFLTMCQNWVDAARAALATPSPQAPDTKPILLCDMLYPSPCCGKESRIGAHGYGELLSMWRKVATMTIEANETREYMRLRMGYLEDALKAARKFIRGKHSTIPFGPQALIDQIDAALGTVPAATQEQPAGSAPLDILASLDREKYTGPAGKIMQAREPAGSGAHAENCNSVLFTGPMGKCDCLPIGRAERITDDLDEKIAEAGQQQIADSVSDWLRREITSALRDAAGSPRKVGEDGALATYLLNTSPPEWEYDKVISMAAESLSLSSPTEPPPTKRKLKPGPYKKWCAEHGQAPPCTVCDYEDAPVPQASSEIRECAHATWAENEQMVKVCMDCTAKFINERWVKRPSMLDAGNSLAYWYHVRCHGGNAQDLPHCKLDGCRQWREALASRQEAAPDNPDHYGLDRPRQGAAKRVEG